MVINNRLPSMLPPLLVFGCIDISQQSNSGMRGNCIPLLDSAVARQAFGMLACNASIRHQRFVNISRYVSVSASV